VTTVITIWDIWDFRERKMEFNHISVGYDSAHKEPMPMNNHQRVAWTGRGWYPRKALLVDMVVTELSDD